MFFFENYYFKNIYYELNYFNICPFRNIDFLSFKYKKLAALAIIANIIVVDKLILLLNIQAIILTKTGNNEINKQFTKIV